MFGPCFVIQYFCPSSFAIILTGKRKLVAVFLLSYDSQCSVALPLGTLD